MDATQSRLATETEAFQVMLEAHRLRPDDEDLHADYLKAKAAVEIAWLEHSTRTP